MKSIHELPGWQDFNRKGTLAALHHKLGSHLGKMEQQYPRSRHRNAIVGTGTNTLLTFLFPAPMTMWYRCRCTDGLGKEKMSILDLLGLGSKGPVHEAPARPASAKEHIVERLKDMPANEAEWIAVFAMVMARAARADFEISPEETSTIGQLLQKYGGLDPEQASLVAEMVTKRNLLLGASDDYLATREFRRIARDGGRERILYCLFAVSAADDSISLVEEEEIRQVANELGIEHGEFTAVRAKFKEKRALLRS